MKIELIWLLGNQGVGKNYIDDILMNQSDTDINSIICRSF